MNFNTMLYPKKVKHRKWFTMRMNRAKEAAHADTRGIALAFGSYGVKAMKYGRVTSNQIEAARKVIMHHAGKTGKVWIRVFPDKPVTALPPEVTLGGGKGDVDHYVFPVKPGRILYELDGVKEAVAKRALEMAGHKMPCKTKFVVRN